MPLSRRRLLASTGWLALGGAAPRLWAQGLGDFTTSATSPGCTGARTATPATREEFYKSHAPERTSLRAADVTGPPLRVTGRVIGLKCGVIAEALVEFWQADAAGLYDLAGLRLRATQHTDVAGHFAFDTVVPGPAAGHARRLHVRVTPPGHPALSTVWFFPDDPTRTSDPAYRPALDLTAVVGADPRTVSLDVVFDL
jgi:protocatechuate 3,4-dioxygenase beta subunit